jgi:hypothetical protein
MTLHRATGRLPALAHCVAALKGTRGLTNGGESCTLPPSYALRVYYLGVIRPIEVPGGPLPAQAKEHGRSDRGLDGKGNLLNEPHKLIRSRSL